MHTVLVNRQIKCRKFHRLSAFVYNTGGKLAVLYVVTDVRPFFVNVCYLCIGKRRRGKLAVHTRPVADFLSHNGGNARKGSVECLERRHGRFLHNG